MDHHNGGGCPPMFWEEAISSLSKGGALMSIDSIIALIMLVVSIITLVIMSVRLGMQISKDTNQTKNDRPSNKR